MGAFTNWRGLSPENTLSRYTDNFFDRAFRKNWEADLSTETAGITVPAVNVREENRGFTLEFAAPGYRKSDFDIQIDNNILTISAEREEKNRETAEDEDGFAPRYTRREFYYHTFNRRFSLPENVEKDKIEAAYNNGILTITVPVKDKDKAKERLRTIAVG